MGRRVIRDLELGIFIKNANFEGALHENDSHHPSEIL